MKKIIGFFFVAVIFISQVSLVNGQTGSFGIVGVNEDIPPYATFVTKGEVVGVNQEDHTVSVHDSKTGMVNVYPVTNMQMLGSVNRGDLIKVFSDRSNTNGSFGVVGINEDIPSYAILVAKGEVADINKEDHTVSVHDSKTGVVNVYSVTNMQMLGSVNRGDLVKIFSRS